MSNADLYICLVDSNNYMSIALVTIVSKFLSTLDSNITTVYKTEFCIITYTKINLLIIIYKCSTTIFITFLDAEKKLIIDFGSYYRNCQKKDLSVF